MCFLPLSCSLASLAPCCAPTAGTIPAEWTELPSLEYLYVRPGNLKLCGPLPEGMNFKVHACACVCVHMAGLRLGLRLFLLYWMAALAWVHSLLQPRRKCGRGYLEGCACHVRSKAGKQIMPSFPTAAVPVQPAHSTLPPHAFSPLLLRSCATRPAIRNAADLRCWMGPTARPGCPPTFLPPLHRVHPWSCDVLHGVPYERQQWRQGIAKGRQGCGMFQQQTASHSRA